MDVDRIATLERQLVELFNQHAISTRSHFITAKNKRPPKDSLIALAEIETTILIVRKNCTHDDRLSVPAYEAFLGQLKFQLFDECETHLIACMGDLADTAKRRLKKYKYCCFWNKGYYQSGKYPSPKSLVDECDKHRLNILRCTQAGFVRVETTGAWNEHFQQYYAAIEWYKYAIKTMNELLAEYKKSWTDSMGIRLRWVAITIPIAAAVFAYLNRD